MYMKTESNEPLTRMLTEKGIITLPAGVIRTYLGHTRLKRHIVGRIAGQLRGLGVRHQPSPFPNDQHVPVRMWLRDSPCGKLLESALRPGTGDQRLAELSGHRSPAPNPWPDVPAVFIDEDIRV